MLHPSSSQFFSTWKTFKPLLKSFKPVSKTLAKDQLFRSSKFRCPSRCCSEHRNILHSAVEILAVLVTRTWITCHWNSRDVQNASKIIIHHLIIYKWYYKCTCCKFDQICVLICVNGSTWFNLNCLLLWSKLCRFRTLRGTACARYHVDLHGLRLGLRAVAGVSHTEAVRSVRNKSTMQELMVEVHLLTDILLSQDSGRSWARDSSTDNLLCQEMEPATRWHYVQ